MGASHPPPPPPPPSEIKVNVYLNMPDPGLGRILSERIKENPNNTDFLSCAAPLPNSGIKASVEAKDSENKNYNVQLNVIDNSINNNDNATKASTNNEEERNIDNNIGQNKIGQKSYIKDLDNSGYSLFNSNNLQEINNNTISNDKEIKNKENYYEKIKDNENDNNKEKNNDNNLLKEGVKNMTDFGDGKEESNENKPETNRGNEIDINMGKKDNICDNNNGITNDGEQKDINIGSNFRKNEEEEDDNYKEYNYSESDFQISMMKNISEEKTLEQTQIFIEQGYFSLFMRLNDYAPKYYTVDKNTTLKLILKTYSENTPQFDMSILNDIKLYCGEKSLDINKRIKDLNLEKLSVITNFVNKTPKL